MELPDDEQPDELIWGNPARLEEWFEAIKQRREQGGGMTPVPEADEDMTGNELTRELLAGG